MKIQITCPPTRPSRRRGMSVNDSGWLFQGSTWVKSLLKLTFDKSLATSFLRFQGKSLCLRLLNLIIIPGYTEVCLTLYACLPVNDWHVLQNSQSSLHFSFSYILRVTSSQHSHCCNCNYCSHTKYNCQPDLFSWLNQIIKLIFNEDSSTE